MREKLWFYIGWGLTLITIIVSITVLIAYGITFNSIKLRIWYMTFLIAFLIETIFIEPIRIVIFSVVTAFRTRQLPPHYPLPELEASPSTETELDRLKRRVDDLMDRFRNGQWKQDEYKNNIEVKHSKETEGRLIRYDKIFNELLTIAFYMLALFIMVWGAEDNMRYYNTRLVRDFLMSGKNDGPIASTVFTQEDLIKYINESIIEKLHRARFHSGLPLLVDPGFIDGASQKILGVARLRQHRIPPNTCSSEYLMVIGNRTDCIGYFESPGRDMDRYSAKWEPWVLFEYSKEYWRLMQPWTYRSASETQTVSVYGERVLYPGGGYVVNLGRNYKNSLRIFDYLVENNWIDERTGVLFIEFTLYNVNSNIFAIVTIVAERQPFGNYQVMSHVRTAKLLFIVSNLTVDFMLAFILFIVLITIFTFRFILYIVDRKLKMLSNLWTIYDAIFIVLNIITVVVFLVRNFHVVNLLQILESNRKNKFISFYYANMLNTSYAVLAAVLVAMTTARLWKILNFAMVFRLLSRSLHRSADSIISTLFILTITMISISCAIHLINGANCRKFFTLGTTLATLVEFTSQMATELKIEDLSYGGQFLGFGLYGLQAVLINTFLMNMFITIACYYFKELKTGMKESEMTEYSFGQYLKDEYDEKKRRMFPNLQRRRHRVGQDDFQRSTSLRLRGGGNYRSKASKENLNTSKDSTRLSDVHYSKEKAALVGELLNAQFDYLERYVDEKQVGSRLNSEIVVDQQAGVSTEKRQDDIVGRNVNQLHSDENHRGSNAELEKLISNLTRLKKIHSNSSVPIRNV